MDADSEYVGVNLGWADKDWGFNEGAQEAINLINTIVSAGYANQVSAIIGVINNIPGGLGGAIAGNTLKRPPIMDAARGLVLANSDLAVQLALTCQHHNPPVRSKLASLSNLVVEYLKGNIPNLWNH